MPAPFENQAPLFYVARETVICAFDLQEITWGVYQSIYKKISTYVGAGMFRSSYVIQCWHLRELKCKRSARGTSFVDARFHSKKNYENVCTRHIGLQRDEEEGYVQESCD